MPGKVYGDPAKIAEKAVARELAAAEKNVEEAYQAGLKLIEDAYEKALRKALDTVTGELQRLQERYESKRSKLELELKNRVAEEKSKYIDMVLEEAFKRLLEDKQGEWYRAYIERSLERALRELPEGDVIVEANPGDLGLVEEAKARVAGGERIKEVKPTEAITGGIVASTPDGGQRVDLSLDLLFKIVEPRLRLVASRALFGQ
ncbi:MAG: V-type ATP synthase subunit E [Desulfurococcales archaeon]|nr:V-type ATP synthase subunit E [Desulfurococcales archaeon]